MRHAATQELFSYWDRVRKGRAAPERSDIEPGDLRTILADTFMLEVDISLQFPFRLAGARTSALFQRELKGTPFLDIWRPECRKPMADLLLSVLDETAPVLAGVETGPGGGRSVIDLELLLLPLRHYGKTHARLMGCLAPRTIPNWFGLLPATGLDLRSIRFVRERETALLLLPPARAAGDPAATSGPVRRAHLTIHPGGRDLTSAP